MAGRCIDNEKTCFNVFLNVLSDADDQFLCDLTGAAIFFCSQTFLEGAHGEPRQIVLSIPREIIGRHDSIHHVADDSSIAIAK